MALCGNIFEHEEHDDCPGLELRGEDPFDAAEAREREERMNRGVRALKDYKARRYARSDVPDAIDVEARAETIARYLPANYSVRRTQDSGTERFVLIQGTDNAGWTLEDYVLPRLASGLIPAYETDQDGQRLEAAQ